MADPSEPAAPASDPAARAAFDTVAGQVVEEVRGLLAELDPGRQPEVRMDSDLEAELGLDSLGYVELAARVEHATGRRVADQLLADIHTVGDLCAVAAGAALPTRTEPVAGAAEPVPSLGPPDRPRAEDRVLAPRGSMRRRLYGVYALVVFGVVSVVAWPLVAVVPGIERRWAVVRAAGRVMFGLTGTRVRVHGRTQLPTDGAAVVVANHTSFVDPLVLAMVLPPPVVFTAVEGLAANPVVRHFLRRMDSYLVAPGDRRRGAAAVTELAERVRAGRVVAMFPEGRRSVRLGVERFHLGAFQVAAAAEVPVVPVALQGTRAILPVGQALPGRAGAGVEVTVGEPVTTTSGTGWLGAIELRKAAREQILRHAGEPDLS